MPELKRDDVTLHYEVDGSGPPLLMIAGMASDSASWAPLLPLLADHFTLIRPDNRTTGRTAPPGAPASVTHFAEDCAAVLAAEGVTRVHVLGHSLGGMIGLELARIAGDQVASLTLAASAPVRLQRNIALFETLIAIRRSDAPEDTWLRALFPWLFAPAVYEAPGAVDEAAAASLAYPFAQSADAMAHQLNALRGYTPPAEMPDVPTQALLAQDDLMMPLDLARAALPQTVTHVLPSAGHSIHWDAPTAVADHVIEFTRNISIKP